MKEKSETDISEWSYIYDGELSLVAIMKDFSAKFSALIPELRKANLKKYPDIVVINPLEYLWLQYGYYTSCYHNQYPRAMIIGMNPGPKGMSQTGIPFGSPNIIPSILPNKSLFNEIRDNEGSPVSSPHRRITGPSNTTVEVSGNRLWSALIKRYGDFKSITSEIFVDNICPLLFLCGKNGSKNLTPDKLTPSPAKIILIRLCTERLQKIYQCLGEPSNIVALGRWSHKFLEKMFPKVRVTYILHPRYILYII